MVVSNVDPLAHFASIRSIRYSFLLVGYVIGKDRIFFFKGRQLSNKLFLYGYDLMELEWS